MLFQNKNVYIQKVSGYLNELSSHLRVTTYQITKTSPHNGKFKSIINNF